MQKSSSSKSGLSVQTIVLAEVAWAVAALLFFMLFSVTLPNQSHPDWYAWGTSIFEAVAYFVAMLLCFRNWGSSQIVSGRNVWLCIGLGMLCYFIGNLLFSYWEIVLRLEPDVSPGDFFFVPTYIFLIAGMLLAVVSRRLNLEIWQWGVVVIIGAVGILLAWFTSVQATNAPQVLMPPAIAQTAPAKPSPKPAAPKVTPNATKASPSPTAAESPKPAVSAPVTPQLEPQPVSVPAKVTSPSDAAAQPPEWATAMGETLKPLKPFLDWYYVISDILLLIMATTLLLAFWGGRFAQSWRMIAAAAFSLYIADIWFKFATNYDPNYQSGSLPEVFWVFSGVLFGIGAALEYDLSSRTRSRTSGRRRAVS